METIEKEDQCELMCAALWGDVNPGTQTLHSMGTKIISNMSLSKILMWIRLHTNTLVYAGSTGICYPALP